MNQQELMELENELFSPRVTRFIERAAFPSQPAIEIQHRPPPPPPEELPLSPPESFDTRRPSEPEERVSYPGQYETLEAVLGSKIRREVVLHTAPYQDARGTMRGWIKKEKRIWSLIVNHMLSGDDTGAIHRTVQNEMKLCNALLEYRDGVLWIPIESKKRLTGFEPGVRDAAMNQVGNHLIQAIRNASKASTAFLDQLTGFDFTRWRGAEQGFIRDFYIFQKEPASKLALQYMDEWASKSEWAMSDDRCMAQMRLVDSVKALACRPNLDLEEWVETTGSCPRSRRPRVLYHD